MTNVECSEQDFRHALVAETDFWEVALLYSQTAYGSLDGMHAFNRAVELADSGEKLEHLRAAMELRHTIGDTAFAQEEAERLIALCGRMSSTLESVISRLPSRN